MTGSTRSSDGLDERRRRVLFRAWHRGMREMDLIMGRFADAFLAGLDEAELAQFEQLIELPDPDLYAWITDQSDTPEEIDTVFFRRVKHFHSNGGPPI